MFFFFNFMYVGILSAHMSVCQMHAWCPLRSEGGEGIMFSGIGVTDGCERYGSNLSLLGERSALLTTESFLSPKKWGF